MRIAFCDDDRAVLSQLEEYIREGNIPAGSSVTYDSFSSGEELLA